MHVLACVPLAEYAQRASTKTQHARMHLHTKTTSATWPALGKTRPTCTAKGQKSARTPCTDCGHAFPAESPATKQPLKARTSRKMHPTGAPCYGESRWRGTGGLRTMWAKCVCLKCVPGCAPRVCGGRRGPRWPCPPAALREAPCDGAFSGGHRPKPALVGLCAANKSSRRRGKARNGPRARHPHSFLASAKTTHRPDRPPAETRRGGPCGPPLRWWAQSPRCRAGGSPRPVPLGNALRMYWTGSRPPDPAAALSSAQPAS